MSEDPIDIAVEQAGDGEFDISVQRVGSDRFARTTLFPALLTDAELGAHVRKMILRLLAGIYDNRD